MYLKGELNKQILQTQNNIDDYKEILQKEEVQRIADMRTFAKEKIERFEKRLVMLEQCLRMYEYLETNNKAEIKEILEG